MPYDPEQVYLAYKKDPNHDMNPYLDFLIKEGRGVILEIGVRWGVSTACFLLSKAEKVYSVDINPACETLYSNNNKWRFILADSTNESAKIKEIIPSEIDVLFIDGDHSYRGLSSDLNYYSGLVKKGGIILCHDVNPMHVPSDREVQEGWPGPYTRAAWNDFIMKSKLKAEVLPGPWGMGVARI